MLLQLSNPDWTNLGKEYPLDRKQQQQPNRPKDTRGNRPARPDMRVNHEDPRRNGPPRKKKKRKSGSANGQAPGQKTAAPAVPQIDYSEYRPAPTRRYAVKMFDTFVEAKSHLADIKSACQGCDQLNVVIKMEGDMTDPELLGVDPKVKLFAGAAWWLIHERRLEEKWFEAPH